jgi:uncharacterized tellurite resistance protein B-like protein
MSNQKNNESILKLLLLMAFADKVYMEEEKELIIKISKQLEISKEKMDLMVDEVEKTQNITEQCRETAKKISRKEDRDKTIKLLSELMGTDKIIHKREIFSIQIIAEEWNMFIEKD